MLFCCNKHHRNDNKFKFTAGPGNLATLLYVAMHLHYLKHEAPLVDFAEKEDPEVLCCIGSEGTCIPFTRSPCDMTLPWCKEFSLSFLAVVS